MTCASFPIKCSFYDRHNQFKEINSKRLKQLMVMTKMASMMLPFYSVSRLWTGLGSNKSNLGATSFLLAALRTRRI
jgi:hypothetical protein